MNGSIPNMNAGVMGNSSTVEANDLASGGLAPSGLSAVSPVHQSEEARTLSLAEQTATDLARG